MPQLETATFLPQLVWLLITFVLLYVLMAKVALPRVAAVVDERKRRLDQDLAEAARLKRETEAAIAEYEQALAAARTQAQAIAGEARAQISAETAAQRSKVEAEIAEKTRAAEASINAAKQQALSQLTSVAADAAADVVARLSGTAPSADAVNAAVAQALGKRG
ncbi:MAG TPA: F0F1 ATP synthase subunit B' [Ferrovibrio sp.]|jgi:F-type H+-transporting ATPase subunit b|uniref:F0F1 ATP synthase subunit B family protein n=1 Tax=Ferrovibrio sp. TaxID=1917215 RepID=UPI002B4AD905|nr:F0F1 ATP synthase subunit B' [Ferrovibrio sp.]HLT76536.1 F0F1 ATP synthase subunit B' [Ferrovibrio sp.]